MLAGKGRGWPKGRALFVFRQDSGIIAWRSDLQVLYEAHLVLAARSESWFPWKTPDSMWQGLFAVAGVIVHSCHSSLRYLLQSTLPWAASPFNTCCPSSQGWVSAAEAAPSLHIQFQRGHKDAMEVCAFQLLCCPTRTPKKPSQTVTRVTECPAWIDVLKIPLPSQTVSPGTLWQVSWLKQVFQAQASPQSSCRNGSVHSARCAHSESCKYTQFVKHAMIKTPMPREKHGPNIPEPSFRLKGGSWWNLFLMPIQIQVPKKVSRRWKWHTSALSALI